MIAIFKMPEDASEAFKRIGYLALSHSTHNAIGYHVSTCEHDIWFVNDNNGFAVTAIQKNMILNIKNIYSDNRAIFISLIKKIISYSKSNKVKMIKCSDLSKNKDIWIRLGFECEFKTNNFSNFYLEVNNDKSSL